MKSTGISGVKVMRLLLILWIAFSVERVSSIVVPRMLTSRSKGSKRGKWK